MRLTSVANETGTPIGQPRDVRGAGGSNPMVMRTAGPTGASGVVP
jgi:hypothetical protein